MKKGKSGFLSLRRYLSLGFLLVGMLFLLPQPMQAKTTELSFALHVPTRSGIYKDVFFPWSKEIEKRTNGRLKIKIYPSQTLVKMKNSYDAVINGIADISWGASGWNAGRFPLTSVVELPFMASDTFAASRALNELIEKFPQMAGEYKDVHFLSIWVTMPYELHTVKKPVRTLEDMKGMKLATQAGARLALEGLGAVPIAMGSAKLYPTVEKGVADGVGLAWGAFKTWKLQEVTNYHTNAHLGGISFWTAMNKSTWNNLPKDIQNIITEVTREQMPNAISTAVTREGKSGRKIVQDLGHEIVELPPAEMARWKATAKPAWDKWADSMEAKGLPGRAVLKEADRLIRKYQP
jgi:TRAP-type transport system periplasmic protein